jgi:hypothetical protein
MATDLTLYLDDEPGELALIGDVLGKAGVNIAGLCALTSGGGQAEVHILVQDATSAFEALEGAGIKIAEEQEVIVLDINSAPRKSTWKPPISPPTPAWCLARTISPRPGPRWTDVDLRRPVESAGAASIR